MEKNKKPIVSTINRGCFKYKMSKEMADAYLKSRSGDEKNKHPQEYLCMVVNNEFGVKGNCIQVIID